MSASSTGADTQWHTLITSRRQLSFYLLVYQRDEYVQRRFSLFCVHPEGERKQDPSGQKGWFNSTRENHISNKAGVKYPPVALERTEFSKLRNI